MDYALIIGIDHYEERPLNGAVKDAEEFAKWLKEAGLIAEPDKNMHLLLSGETNEFALDAHIDKTINKIIDDAKKYKDQKNRLYFYFSGHGIGVSFSKTALCLRYWYSKMPNYCISSLEYKDGLINKGVFDEILIFLDCCREFDYQTDTKVPGFDYQTKVGTKNPQVMVCYSTTYGKLSYEISPENTASSDANQKRGAFTSFLIEGLRGDADADNNGTITALDLKNHISSYFKNYALKFNKVQDADVETNIGGDNIIICKLENKNEDFNYVITFTRNADVSLFDGSNELIKRANVQTGETWEVKLKKGLHKLSDNNSPGTDKYFTNFNINTVNHEQF
jgi:hypothetical protein